MAPHSTTLRGAYGTQRLQKRCQDCTYGMSHRSIYRQGSANTSLSWGTNRRYAPAANPNGQEGCQQHHSALASVRSRARVPRNLLMRNLAYVKHACLPIVIVPVRVTRMLMSRRAACQNSASYSAAARQARHSRIYKPSRWRTPLIMSTNTQCMQLGLPHGYA